MKRNKFSLSRQSLHSFDMGHLLPIGLTEVLPGDTIQQATAVLLRCQPMLAPVMHACDVRIHHFYVPNRILWDEWEDFITGGPSGASIPAVPVINATNLVTGGAADNYGLPTGLANTVQVSALPFRGYSLIWNEYYRDQDLQSELPVPKTGGVDATTITYLLRCNWEKDYFTTARPWEQKGPSVSVPMPVSGLGLDFGAAAGGSPGYIVMTPPLADKDPGTKSGTALRAVVVGPQGTISSDTRPSIYAQGSINQLREAFALQRYEEARARYGSRYVEYLRYLGIRSSDARLQRPEYLGGGRATIQFSEVLQTAPGVDTSVGELRGHGITGMRSNRYRRFIEEHGFIHSLLSVRPRAMYMQGVEKMWNRRAKEDYWQREFEHIGQEAVLEREVWAADPATLDNVWGYQDRYATYRQARSYVAGEFKTSLLNYWHLGRDFGSKPALNSTFVECTPSERIFAVTSKSTLLAMVRHSVQARRLVSRSTHSHVF